jgi:predicted O-methyltransferase YrrM
MTTLASLADNKRTDKNTTHCYLDLYQELFGSKKETAKHVLEVGVQQGGSFKLWYDYFTNATIHGYDLLTLDYMNQHYNFTNEVLAKMPDQSRVHLVTGVDAYLPDNIIKYVDPNIRYDVMVDDGPHTLESMVKFIILYLPLLAPGGVLVIEDIPRLEWTDVLMTYVHPHLRANVKVYDLRPIKQRFDDIIMVVHAPQPQPVVIDV